MKKLSDRVWVVGGVYREIVRSPRREELFGSGGRAAATIAALGGRVTLRTAMDGAAKSAFDPIAGTFGFQTVVDSLPQTTQFIYEHALGRPRTWPLLNNEPLETPLKVSENNVLAFGMVEGNPTVQAQRLIYDPQNPWDPRWLEQTGSSAEDAVYLLNQREGRALTKATDPEAIIKSVLRRSAVRACVLKLGPRGALLGERSKALKHIPCYSTPRVWPIGSGDVFAGALAWAWFCQGYDLVKAAHSASRATALYASSEAIPSQAELINGKRKYPFAPVGRARRRSKRRYDVYLAGPFFSFQNQWLIEETRDVMSSFGFRVFSPCHDVGHGSADKVAPQDLKALTQSRVILALLDNLDPGTLFEVGYARARGIPVVAYVHDTPDVHLKMIEGSGCDVERDFPTALYKAAWACE